MASLRCLSCFIFLRADLIAFFAIVIHFDKVFVFSFENFEMSLSSNLYYSCGLSSACFFKA